jgi:hypothetical protein
MVEERVKTVAEGAGGDRPLKLDSPVGPSQRWIRFSQDGHYLPAQDEAGISVMDHGAGKMLFHIEAPDAEAAQFTPDSQGVVFHDSSLRVERWDVAAQKRTYVKEMVVFEGCNRTLLAPDRRTLVCVTVNTQGDRARVGLRLIDVESGQTIFEKPKFNEVVGSSQYIFYLMELNLLSGASAIHLQVSPDGRNLVAMMGNRTLGYDLEHRQILNLGGELKDPSQKYMSFLGSDEMFVVSEDVKANGLRKTRTASFPDGRVLEEGQIGDQQLSPTSKGRTLIAGPLKDYAIGILDPEKHQYNAQSKLAAIDAWENHVSMEDRAGGVFLGETGKAEGRRHISLPMGSLPRARAAEFSRDGKYLAVSLKDRGEVWDLTTGKQVLLTRPFRSAWSDQDGHLLGMFPKYVDKDPAVLEMEMKPPGGKALFKPEDDDWQYSNLELHFKPMGKDKGMDHHATLEVRKLETQAMAWSREYPHETPACWKAEDERLVLAWDLSDETARSEIRVNPTLQREVAAIKNGKKGLLIETVVQETGTPLEQVVIPEVDLSRGWNDERRAVVSGEFVLMRGEHSNTGIYRMDTGVKVGEFFGTVVATDAGSCRIAAANREEEIVMIDERDGKELQRLTLGSPIRLARIVNNQQKVLMVLAADQVVHRLPLPD